jgi:hypothetical protein
MEPPQGMESLGTYVPITRGKHEFYCKVPPEQILHVAFTTECPFPLDWGELHRPNNVCTPYL